MYSKVIFSSTSRIAVDDGWSIVLFPDEAYTAAMSSPRIAVLVNAQAGGTNTEELVRDIREQFRLHHLEPDLALIHPGTSLREKAQAVATAGYSVVAAAGGDGTIRTVAESLIGTSTTLGILPLGTLNHLAKDLHIPLDLAGAIRAVAEGQPKSIDAAEVNDQIFLNNSSIGLYPKIVRHRERLQASGHHKWSAFISAAAFALKRYSLVRVRLASDHEQGERETPFVLVGNNAYTMRGLDLGARERLDEHTLAVYLAPRAQRRDLFRWALGALLPVSPRDLLTIHRSAELWIETRKSHLSVALDGEVVVLPTPLHYRILPNAITVMVP